LSINDLYGAFCLEFMLANFDFNLGFGHDLPPIPLRIRAL
jgi:hypothetical protein